MRHCSHRIGDAYFRTPRNTVTAFVNLLSVLEQNPGAVWRELLDGVEVSADTGEDLTDIADANLGEQDDELASFKL